MNLQIFDDISSTSKEMENTRNLLYHTLHLEYEEIIKNSDFINYYHMDTDNYNAYIDYLFQQCDSICTPLFYKNSAFNFFGLTGTNNRNPYSDLSLDGDFWKSSIKYHCTISALHTLIHYLIKNVKVSAYKSNTYIKNQGIFYLTNNDFFNFADLEFNKYNKRGMSNNASNNCSNFSRQFSELYKKLSENERIMFGYHDNLFPLGESNFNYCLFENRKSFLHLREWYAEDSPISSSQSFFKELSNFYSSLYKPVENNVDSLLLQYKVERYYNFSMTAKLMNLVIDATYSGKTYSIDSFPPQLLVSCFHLPNVFSRNIYLSYALNSYNNEVLDTSVFYQRLQNTGPVFHVGPSTTKIERLLKWLNLYKRFSSFFSFVIFPIYERCFFLLLHDSLKDVLKKDNLTEVAIEVLSKYILLHFNEITNGGCDSKYTKNDLNGQVLSNIAIPTGEYFYDRSHQIAADLFLKNILTMQNSIIHPKPIPEFNSQYFGIKPNSSHQHALMNVYINSTLEHMEGIIGGI